MLQNYEILQVGIYAPAVGCRVTNEDLHELIADCDAADPGPWYLVNDLLPEVYRDDDGYPRTVVCDVRETNARHIANCDPPTMEALVKEVQACRAEQHDMDKRPLSAGRKRVNDY